MLVNGNIVELRPVDGRKSFYGKAQAVLAADGSKTLYSYGTAIVRINADNSLSRLWYDWSATTQRHINSFFETFGVGEKGKLFFTSLN